jgi:ankyrin repeat protein
MKKRSKFIVCVLLLMAFTSILYTQDIFRAAYNGDLATVRKMVEANRDVVNSRNAIGRFPLEMAAQTGQLAVVKYLLANGADVNLNRGGATALHMASLYGGKLELVTLLLESGADMNARTGSGYTPLNLAVLGRQKAIAELLLDKGAEINLDNMDFSELLYISASAGIQRIVDMALQPKVDFRYTTGTGDTLLHAAAEGGLTGLARTCLAKGLDVEAANVYGQTPLHIAARGGHQAVLEVFLDNGANPDIRTKNGKTPLHFAREKGHEAVVAFLKAKGAADSEWKFPLLTGKYLGQPSPGEIPQLFAPGIVSAQEHFEHSCLAFAPDYSEVYWSTDFIEQGFYDIVYMKNENGKWTEPRLAPFSKKHHAGSPVFAHDGKTLYFSSTRPTGEQSGKSDVNIWRVTREGHGWSEPQPLSEVINTGQGEVVLSIARSGTLFFRREMELFFSRQIDGVYQAPEKLDLTLDSGTRLISLYIAPDESYMILESFGGGGHGGADLYVCYGLKEGAWSQPINLGPTVNSGATERFPCVTPDGRYLFFIRVSDGSDYFWVDSKVIEEMKPAADDQ